MQYEKMPGGGTLSLHSPGKRAPASHPLLKAIAVRHQATPLPVGLNWLVRQPGVIAIPMSTDPLHLEEICRQPIWNWNRPKSAAWMI